MDQLSAYAISSTDNDDLRQSLTVLKSDKDLDELLYVSTCNRVFYFFVTDQEVDDSFIRKFHRSESNKPMIHYQGDAAILHLFQVASSIHSMVVGERQILRQIRDSYQLQSAWGLSGDYIRLGIEQMIRSAKKVYSTTKIGDRPVSVVSLAVQKLIEFNLDKSARFILVGAGKTIQLVLKHLSKKGFTNFSIYNRSLESAKKIGEALDAETGSLDDLNQHSSDFECLIACTGSNSPTVSHDLAENLSKGNIGTKIWMDLGIPADISKSIQKDHKEQFIGIESLKSLAAENMRLRKSEVDRADIILDEAVQTFSNIIYHRRVELAFRQVPKEIKVVKEKALTEVFKKELDVLDENTQGLVMKMMDYMEKKCIGIPMKAAKEAANLAPI